MSASSPPIYVGGALEYRKAVPADYGPRLLSAGFSGTYALQLKNFPSSCSLSFDDAIARVYNSTARAIAFLAMPYTTARQLD